METRGGLRKLRAASRTRATGATLLSRGRVTSRADRGKDTPGRNLATPRSTRPTLSRAARARYPLVRMFAFQGRRNVAIAVGRCAKSVARARQSSKQRLITARHAWRVCGQRATGRSVKAALAAHARMQRLLPPRSDPRVDADAGRLLQQPQILLEAGGGLGQQQVARRGEDLPHPPLVVRGQAHRLADVDDAPRDSKLLQLRRPDRQRLHPPPERVLAIAAAQHRARAESVCRLEVAEPVQALEHLALPLAQGWGEGERRAGTPQHPPRRRFEQVHIESNPVRLEVGQRPPLRQKQLCVAAPAAADRLALPHAAG
mmetsp:Transcript_41245/g.136688  ORF Transcript_41245/g.136688 Transcript_41245/m.136688 type:complete len:316 (-) Transcript_41245:389-1336(-)